MREHALPQDVTGYRFHIIGNMTLKQFAEVAIGVVAGFFIYQTNLPVFLKWPFILIAAGIGAFAAFVPFEERPFDHWIVAFFQSLYRPTQFYWKRSSKIPDAFLYQPNSNARRTVGDVDLSPARQQRVQDYLHSVQGDAKAGDQFDQLEGQQITSLMDIFSTMPAQDLSKIDIKSPRRQRTQTPVLRMHMSEPVPAVNIQLQPGRGAQSQSFDTAAANAILIANQTGQAKTPEVSLAPPVPDNQALSSNSTQYSSVSVPQSGAVAVEPTQLPANQMATQTPDAINQTYMENTDVVRAVTAPTANVVQNAQLPFPEKPTEPNKVVGMVLDQNNMPLPAAIVEILTPDGFSARAVKTNLLGQFFISTPLNNGTYTITADKEGHQFAAQQLVLDGSILNPIEVRSIS